jgi:hypothetical protein
MLFHPRLGMKDAYVGLAAWVAAGKPNNAYIHDRADTLKACGIPICDGAFVRGFYRRIPLLPRREVNIIVLHMMAKELKPYVVKITNEGIEAAETKDHHRMSYG